MRPKGLRRKFQVEFEESGTAKSIVESRELVHVQDDEEVGGGGKKVKISERESNEKSSARNLTNTSSEKNNSSDIAGNGSEEYSGLAAYKSYNALPTPIIRSNQFIRNTSRFDYAPDVCKDYKESGFCGFGDSCKFVHDRSDYKSGWELERDFKRMQNEKEKSEQVQEEEEEEEESVCPICQKDYTKPVVTRCNHVFCEKCILKRFVKNSKCPVCGDQTQGIFNAKMV